MTRISGVFANAIFGALAVVFFSGALQKQIQPLSLSAKERKAVIQQATDLGNAKVPATVSSSNKTVVEKAYHTGFYQRVCKCYADIGSIRFFWSVYGANIYQE